MGSISLVHIWITSRRNKMRKVQYGNVTYSRSETLHSQRFQEVQISFDLHSSMRDLEKNCHRL